MTNHLSLSAIGSMALASATLALAACSSSSASPAATPDAASGGNDGGVSDGAASAADGNDASGPPAAWPLDRFPVSAWCGPPDSFTSNSRYQELAQAGFTFAMEPCLGIGEHTLAANMAILDAAQAAGLKVIVWDKRIPGRSGDGSSVANRTLDTATAQTLDAIVADYSSHPALAAYFLDDEPSQDSFGFWGQVVDHFRQKDPSHPTYMNLLPTYGFSSITDYDTYLKSFVASVSPVSVCYDHYPLLAGGDSDAFFTNLAMVRERAQGAGLPYWTIVQSAQWPGMREPTEPELRWQAMQALAYGMKGLIFFTYWDFPAAQIQGGPITADGGESSLYAAMGRVNSDVRAIGDAILATTSKSVYESGTVPPGGNPLPSSAPVSIGGGASITVGVLEGGGHTYIVLANGSHSATTSSDVTLTNAGSMVEHLDKTTRAWDAQGTSGAVHVELAAGDGELYRW